MGSAPNKICPPQNFAYWWHVHSVATLMLYFMHTQFYAGWTNNWAWPLFMVAAALRPWKVDLGSCGSRGRVRASLEMSWDHGRELRSGWEGPGPSRAGKVNRRHMVKKEPSRGGARGAQGDQPSPVAWEWALGHWNYFQSMDTKPLTVWNRWTFRQI